MADLLSLHPEVGRRVAQLRAWSREFGVPFTITSAYRSPADQRRLFAAWLARGRTGLPAARPGWSTHEHGYAIDLVARDAAALRTIVDLAGCAGLVWAGPKDPVHFDVWGFAGWARLLAGRPFTPSYRC